jgi:D-aminopeptidase
MPKFFATILLLISFLSVAQAQNRGRARDFGIKPGILTPGNWNAITDVKGVSVGQKNTY